MPTDTWRVRVRPEPQWDCSNQRIVQLVPCRRPHCRAEAGVWCRTKDGQEDPFHAVHSERVVDAELFLTGRRGSQAPHPITEPPPTADTLFGGGPATSHQGALSLLGS